MKEGKYIITVNPTKLSPGMILEVTQRDNGDNTGECIVEIIAPSDTSSMPIFRKKKMSGDHIKFEWRFGGRLGLYRRNQLVMAISDFASVVRVENPGISST